VTTKAGGTPGPSILFKHGGLTAALSQLEGTNSNNNNSADQSAQSSGFSSKNSGQPPGSPPNFNQNGPPNTNNKTLTNAVSFSNPAGQPVGNSTLQNQNVINTVPTNSTVPTTNTVPTTSTVPTTNPNNNPTPPSGPTSGSQTLTGFAGGLVVIDQPAGNGDPARFLDEPSPASWIGLGAYATALGVGEGGHPLASLAGDNVRPENDVDVVYRP
jgi:hypothetical protein